MARKRGERESTGWRISVEAKRLLERLAERSAISQAAVLEQAIREKAQREQVGLDGEAADDASAQLSEPPASPEPRAAARERLWRLAERVRAGGQVTPEEFQREIDLLCAGATVTPAKRSGPHDPVWQERFQRLLDEVRAGVPEEWTEAELHERVKQAVAEVRADRAGRR
jgi:hypothetical protein